MTRLAPDEAGQRVAALFESAAMRLFEDLAQSGAIPEPARASARQEWDYYALFGCVRGIVAARGFAPKTADTINTLHSEVFRLWDATALGGMDTTRRATLGRRYEAYETIAQAGGAAGADDVAQRLGAEAARHMIGEDAAADIVDILGSMHELLAEAVVAVLSGEGDVPSV